MKSYAFTYFSAFVVLVAGFLTLKLAAIYMGTLGFGEYSVVKRGLPLFAYPLILGFGNALPRYVALRGRSTDQSSQVNYLLASLILASLATCVFSASCLAVPDLLALVVFGQTEYGYLISPMLLGVAGLALHTLAYGYYRGQLRMWEANSLQILNTAVVPLVAIFLGRTSVSMVIALTGILSGVVALIVCVWVILTSGLSAINWPGVARSGRELLGYGVPRIPGEIAWFGLFAVPTMLIARFNGIEDAGYFSFGVSLLHLISSAFAPSSTLLLPYVSRLMSQNDWPRIRKVTSVALWLSIPPVTAAVLALQLVLGHVVPFFLSDSFAEVINYSRWMLIATVPYVLYLMLRAPLDAVTEWPHNSVNLVATLVLAIVLVAFAGPILSAPAAMFLSIVLLAALTLFSWQSALRTASRHLETLP